MTWSGLRDVHLKGCTVPPFTVAVLEGNEDWPTAITLIEVDHVNSLTLVLLPGRGRCVSLQSREVLAMSRQRRSPHYESDDVTFSADAYRVSGYGGIAWYVLGWETEPDEDTELTATSVART
jgi:hypothetical protein